jgi:hypothetical protein
MDTDKLWMRLVDNNGNLYKNIFDRVRVLIDPSTPADFPKAKVEEDLAGGLLSFRQILPYSEPDKYNPATGDPKDKAFRLTAAVNGSLEKTARIDWNGNKKEMVSLEAGIQKKDLFIGCITLQEGLNTDLAAALQPSETPGAEMLDFT